MLDRAAMEDRGVSDIHEIKMKICYRKTVELLFATKNIASISDNILSKCRV